MFGELSACGGDNAPDKPHLSLELRPGAPRHLFLSECLVAMVVT